MKEIDYDKGKYKNRFRNASNVERDKIRQEFIREHANDDMSIVGNEYGRMTPSEYRSIANEEDADRIAKEYGIEDNWFLSSGNWRKERPEGISTYGTWWDYYPEDIQRELVRRMNILNGMSRTGLSYGGAFDGTDLETVSRAKAIAYPANANYWRNYADALRENNMNVGYNSVNEHSKQGKAVLDRIARNYVNPQAYYSSEDFKNDVYNREMEDLYSRLGVAQHSQHLDEAYRRMIEANRLAHQKEYDDISEDSFNGYLID